MTSADIETVLKTAESLDAAEDVAFRWRVCDGHCNGAEFVWLPVAERWVWFDGDSGECGSASELTLILSDADGDTSGLNALADLVTVEFSGGPGLWILSADLPADVELPDDAAVYLLGNPSEGIEVVEVA